MDSKSPMATDVSAPFQCRHRSLYSLYWLLVIASVALKKYASESEGYLLRVFVNAAIAVDFSIGPWHHQRFLNLRQSPDICFIFFRRPRCKEHQYRPQILLNEYSRSVPLQDLNLHRGRNLNRP